MTPAQPGPATLEELLAALAERPLDEAERVQLNQLVQQDDAELSRLVDDLELDAMLQWHFGRVASPQIPPPAPAKETGPSPRLDRVRLGLSMVAVAVVAVVGIGLYLIRPQPPVGVPIREMYHELASGWTIRPSGEAEFEILDHQHLRLERGELFVQSMPEAGSQAEPLWIETRSATAHADGTEFYIGAHQPSDSGGTIMSPVTRVLVLAGVVTLANAAGEARGQSGDLLTAEQDSAPVRMVVQANNDFAWSLYDQLEGEESDGNLFFSPYSISTALAMAAEGARGQTALEMGEVLGYPDEARRIGDDAQLIPWRMSLLNSGMAQLQERLSARDDESTREIREQIASLRDKLESVNQRVVKAQEENDFNSLFAAQREGQSLAREINELLTQVEQYELTVANAVWGDRSFPFDDEYVATINQTFQTGGVFTLDFAGNPDGARGEINSWIADQTAGLIPEMLGPRSISPATRLVLTNAVHFLGFWSEPFEEDATQPADFRLTDDENVEIPFMYGLKSGARYGAINGDGSWFDTPEEVRRDGADEDSRYPAADGFQILEMPYKGGELSMVVILPRATEGLTLLHDLLVAGELEEWLPEMQRRDVRVLLPKFEAEGSYSLVETLRALGMERAFASAPPPQGADFSGMTVSRDIQNLVYIESVQHKARISVHERGTEAVAATVVIAEPTAAPPPVDMVPFTPAFRADRPFAYVIRDRESGAILFVGTMRNPSEQE